MRKIVLFDMDGTLTKPRKEIEPDMIRTLRSLEKEYEIGIVTGSDFEYIKQQIEPALDIGGLRLSNYIYSLATVLNNTSGAITNLSVFIQ